MIAGRIGADARARFPLQASAPGDLAQTIDAVFDSGFDGFLTMSPELFRLLGLPMETDNTIELADGSMQRVRSFVAVVALEGEELEIDVSELPGEPLAGVQLLAGFRVTIDLVPDGAVRIERLP